MNIREADITDIKALHDIRMAVRENVLHNPALVTREDYQRFLSTEGKGWLIEAGDRVAGFAIVDMPNHNVWALFVHPHFEGLGVGKALMEALLEWYFAQTDETLWLSTGPATRAEEFYHRTGWAETGVTKGGETRFEMTKEAWKGLQPK
jgi:GNAT superfamily N-acetyltransferase